MAELSGPHRRHNRVNWVGLRTLRQRPTVIGETEAGEPIVEVRSVRLVLRDGANHFSRMATCAKCGREIPGGPVLTPGDLDAPAHPVICRDCARTAAAPLLEADRLPVARRAPAPAGGAGETNHAPPAAVEDRIAELEALVRRERAGWDAALEARMDAAQTEVRALAAKELARAQEDVDRMMKGMVGRLTERLEDQRSELAADLDARAAQIRAGLDDRLGHTVSEMDGGLRSLEVARAQEELSRRLDESAGKGAARIDAVEAESRALHHSFKEWTVGAQEELGRRIGGLEAQLGGLRNALDAAATQARAHETVLAGRLASMEAQVRVVEDAGAARAAEVARNLTEAQKELEKRVQGLVDERVDLTAGEGARIEAALSERLDRHAERMRRAQADDGRVEAVEQRLGDAVARLAAMMESQRAELDREVNAGLAEIRSALSAVKDDSAGGLRAIEKAMAQRAGELTDLTELQTSLDAGLGELRSEIEQLRESAAKAAQLDDRLESLVDLSQLGAPERGRLGARKATDAIAGLTAAFQGLLQDHRQLHARLATIENESETAVTTSARASAQAAGVQRMRQEVLALRNEVAAQNEAIADLGKAVERLRRAVQSKPTAKPAPAARATKATKATKKG